MAINKDAAPPAASLDREGLGEAIAATEEATQRRALRERILRAIRCGGCGQGWSCGKCHDIARAFMPIIDEAVASAVRASAATDPPQCTILPSPPGRMDIAPCKAGRLIVAAVQAGEIDKGEIRRHIDDCLWSEAMPPAAPAAVLSPEERAEVQAIGERLRAATPGPWQTLEAHGTPWSIEAADGSDVAMAQQLVADPVRSNQPQRTANARFIAAAPTDIARLIALLDRLTSPAQPTEESRGK